MKFLIVCLALIAPLYVSAIPTTIKNELPLAEKCVKANCKLPDCRCAGYDIPGGLPVDKTPQFVLLTFDDAVQKINFEYYSKALFGRKNRDNCNVSATVFTTHKYTDYSKVHELYENGFEVALHSITHSGPTDYWKNASVELLLKEFGGEIEMLNKFANVPKNALKGVRIPFLQLSGNNSFEMMKELGLEYDCSWPARLSSEQLGLWPYTLEYKSVQECPIGPCPTASFPNIWEVPMLDWTDQNGIVCAMVDACVNIPSEVDELFEWFKTNFNRTYTNNKAPFGFFVHAAWFQKIPNGLEAYIKFIDYLQSLEDVYIVNFQSLLDWIKHPVALDSDEWLNKECPKVEKSPCKPVLCGPYKDGESEIYMTICNGPCPFEYPTLDNPTGE